MSEKLTAKRPAFQFYPGDWLRDTPLRSCSIASRGLWVDLMCLMHDGEPYGHLAVNGRPLSDAQAASMVGLSLPQYRKLLREIEGAGVSSRTGAGVLFSRRMVRDEHIRTVRAASGKKGGNPSLLDKQRDNQADNHNTEQTGQQSPTPAVAVASAGTTTPPPPPARATSDPLARCRREIPDAYRPTLEGSLRAARNPDAIAAELCAIADGLRGNPPPTWEHLGLALHDLAVAGAHVTANTLRAFARRARDGAGTLRDPPAGAGGLDGDGTDWGELERQERERQRQKQEAIG